MAHPRMRNSKTETPTPSMDTVTLRSAVIADAEAITELFMASRLEAMPYLPILYTQAEVQWWIRNIVLKETSVVVAVSSASKVLGFCSVRDDMLEHLYVATDAQCLGVGSLLLKNAQQEASTGLRLHVFQRNTQARTFYENRGFKLEILRDGSENEERTPDAVYHWSRPHGSN